MSTEFKSWLDDLFGETATSVDSAPEDGWKRREALTDLNKKDYYTGTNYEFVDDGDGNIITSSIADAFGWHAPVLDIDIPHQLIPSSTPGHSHLYFDIPIPQDKYFKLLEALADCGIIEKGYLGASEARGFTAVRKPGVKKEVVSDGVAGA